MGRASSDFEIQDHLGEIALAVVVATSSFAVVYYHREPAVLEVTLVVDTIAAILAISVALLKLHINKLIKSSAIRNERIYSISNQVGSILELLTGRPLNHARVIMDDSIKSLKKIRQGILPLDVPQYYAELAREMEKASKGTMIIAVSSINARRWADDPRQRKYLEDNFSAKKRGADISRVFIVESQMLSAAGGSNIRESIFDQLQCNFEIYIVDFNLIHDRPELLDDFVIFKQKNGEAIALRDFPDNLEDTRIARGELILDKGTIQKFENAFDQLKAQSYPRDEYQKLLKTP